MNNEVYESKGCHTCSTIILLYVGRMKISPKLQKYLPQSNRPWPTYIVWYPDPTWKKLRRGLACNTLLCPHALYSASNQVAVFK